MAANGNLRASVKEALIALPALQVSDFERNLMAVGYLTAVFEAEGIRPIIVGGHAIETYTQGFYTTKDVDLVLRGRADALDILRELGFQQYHDLRHWYFPQLRLPIEIVDSDLAGSEERLLRVHLPNDLHIYVIGIEDLVLDRARGSLYWNSGSHRDWTVHLLALNLDQVDRSYLLQTAEAEDPRLRSHLETLLREAEDHQPKLP